MIRVLTAVAAIFVAASVAVALEKPQPRPIEVWVETQAQAVGTSATAKEEAVSAALRKAVEQGCGVFLTSQSKTEDYTAVYDKIIANTVGYIVEHKVIKEWQVEDMSFAKVRALVSTRRFKEDWAKIAHTIHQENNPRVMIAIAEVTYTPATQWATEIREVKEAGAIQSKLEDFFLDKGIRLIDKETVAGVSRRDILLASMKDDTAAVAAMGAKFNADVVIVGQASAKCSGNAINLGGATIYPYSATLNVRAIQCDSGALLVSKAFGPYTTNSLQLHGGEDKALAKIGDLAPPEVLKAIIDAWAKRGNVSRTLSVTVAGMDYDTWKTFKALVEKIDGVQALRLREITESVASIDVEYKFTNERLADRLTAIKEMPMAITELNPNRLKLKVIK